MKNQKNKQVFPIGKTVFEHLNMGDSERMHSEFLCWIFSKNCLGLTEESKKSLFEKIFKIKNFGDIEKIQTEINKADLFIESNNHVMIVENKLKSSEHSNQLQRYAENLEKNYKNKRRHYFFLTLINEKSSNEAWINISYEHILDAFKELKLTESKHCYYIQDYILYLEKLIYVLNDVLERPDDNNNVFENGNKTKTAKLEIKYKNEKEKFIALNQLETILQKAFLKKFLMENQISDIDATIKETRGTALINFMINDKINIKNDHSSYRSFIQLQKSTIKFAFAISKDEYKSSTKTKIKDVITIFENIYNNQEDGFDRLNKPKSRAYISMSRHMDIPYWKLETHQFINEIKNAIDVGTNLTSILLEKIGNEL